MYAWREFLATQPRKTYAKGQLIICQGAQPDYCYCIRRGFVKAYIITADGDEKPISFESVGDIFPLDVTFGRTPETKYYFQAYTDCEVYQIPREAFLQFVEAHPQSQARLTHYLIDRNISFRDHISSLERAKAADKLIYALHLLTKRFGRRIANERLQMTLPITQQDLANFLGLTRETTGTHLKALERGGVVRYHRQKYIVYADRLEALIDER